MQRRRTHHPVRVWWAPWRHRCQCGCSWYPCPDGVPAAPAPDPQVLAAYRPDWNAPTVTSLPLLTPGQAWRSRRDGGGR